MFQGVWGEIRRMESDEETRRMESDEEMDTSSPEPPLQTPTPPIVQEDELKSTENTLKFVFIGKEEITTKYSTYQPYSTEEGEG